MKQTQLELQPVDIQPAVSSEAQMLTDIAFAAKRYWDYPQSYFDIWTDELTITPEYIKKNKVFTVKIDNRIVGFCSIREVEEDSYIGEIFVNKGFWLDHLFIDPEYIGMGVGNQLMDYVNFYCKDRRISNLFIFSDPFAKGFYDKVGAKYVRESPSSIPGRTLPVYEYVI